MATKTLLSATAIIATLLVAVPAETEAQTRTCDGKTAGCWQKYSNLNCYRWVTHVGAKPTTYMTWSGGCSNGKLSGHGVERLLSIFESEGRYKNGKKEGNWVTRSSGDIDQEGSYKNGERTGDWVEHWDDGIVREGPYVNGERHGEWVERDADGTVREIQYVNGERQE